MSEREPCACGTDLKPVMYFEAWECLKCLRRGPQNDVDGEQWDRDMRDIRAGREVET